MTQVTLIKVLNDNYCYLIESGGQYAVVDPGEAQPVIDYLDLHNIKPDVILNTHHHGDHIAGNQAIKDRFGCKIIGPEKDRSRIPNMDEGVTEGDIFSFGEETVQVFETPGHTSGHICFYFEGSHNLFCGDTLFVMGCGRLFEGTPEEMWRSFEKIKTLPDDTNIYCGHEYTLANAKFCAHAEPDNAEIKGKLKEIEALRQANKPTIPSTLIEELETNVFLRAKDADHFAELRAQKDNF